MIRLQTPCPGCGHDRLEALYSQKRVPVHSVILLHDHQCAIDFPRGEIALGFCPACGLATNTAFDPGLVAYTAACEETQDCSATFREFHRELAESLVKRFNLRHKRVVEIGCGKGAFLSLLCLAGGNRGLGFDPAYRRGEVTLPAGTRIVPEYFGSGQRLRDADFVCCKMTLEHIAAPRDFLVELRRSIDRPGIPVYFQVPDASRIYRTSAFWDIYYEHCTYFSRPSLERLFAGAGFRVDALDPVYAEQYLALYAHTAPAPAAPARPAGLDETRELAERFRNTVEVVRSGWKDAVATTMRSGGRTVVWGGGSKAVAFLTALDLQGMVDSVVDINPNKHGTYLPGTGHRVTSPDELRGRPPDLVVAMNRIYVPEIRARLVKMKLFPRIESLP